MSEQGGHRPRKNQVSSISPILAISALFIVGAMTAYAIWQISIPPARLEVSPTEPISLSVEHNGPNPADQTLTIKNSGGRPLAWIAHVTTDWIKLRKTQGDKLQPNTSEQIALSLDITGLAPGLHTGRALFSLKDSQENSIAVNIELTVVERPAKLEVEPSSLEFAVEMSKTPLSQSFTIRNSGGQPLTWSADESSTWINLSPSNGSLNAGESVSVIVYPNTSGMSAGTKDATISVHSSSAPKELKSIAVALDITKAPARLSVYNGRINFSYKKGSRSAPAPAFFEIRNSGRSPMTWNVRSGSTWITLDPTRGTLQPDRSVRIGISIDPEVLSRFDSGSLTDQITVTAIDSMNSPLRVTVNLLIEPAPPLRFGIGVMYIIPSIRYWLSDLFAVEFELLPVPNSTLFGFGFLFGQTLIIGGRVATTCYYDGCVTALVASAGVNIRYGRVGLSLEGAVAFQSNMSSPQFAPLISLHLYF